MPDTSAPLAVRTRIVLLEIAAGAALVAIAFQGLWLGVGAAVALVCAALALVTVHGRPLYAVIRSWIGLRMRRPKREARDNERPRDSYRVTTIPPSGRGAAVGAIEGDTTWSVPLSLPLSGLVNEDPPLDLNRLATLLRVEDVPLANVRIVTVSTPAMPADSSLAGPEPRPNLRVSRHLVLTLDTAHAADVIAERGGAPAIHQILRRCVLRAEEILNASGIEVARLSEGTVATDAAWALGRPPTGADTSLHVDSETMSGVQLADTSAKTFSVSGDHALEQLAHLAQHVPAPVVATCVMLRPGPRAVGPLLDVLIRVSGTDQVVAAAEQHLVGEGRRTGLRIEPVLGEQLPMLQVTTLLGLPRGSAA